MNILVAGAGSGGGDNVIRSIKASSLDVKIIGTNKNKYDIWRTKADKAYLVPAASKENYIEELNNIVSKENIDLVIAANTIEMTALSEKRKELNCKIFLPDKEIVDICNDKEKTHRFLKKNNFPCSTFKRLWDLNDIHLFMEKYPAEKYWIRSIEGSGSLAATRIETEKQAKDWINLWVELQGMKVTDFMIEEFLPGKDYALQSVWKDNTLMVMKLVRRVEYVHMRNTLSGTSSSPVVAITENDKEILDLAKQSIIKLNGNKKIEGNFSIDFRRDRNNIPNITEFNVGRFCMITPIFDFTGEINTVEMHIRCALGLDISKIDPIDIEEGVYLLRGLDMEPKIYRG